VWWWTKRTSSQVIGGWETRKQGRKGTEEDVTKDGGWSRGKKKKNRRRGRLHWRGEKGMLAFKKGYGGRGGKKRPGV